MWQLTSDEFLLYHDGFLNAPAQASAYPLCKKNITPVPGMYALYYKLLIPTVLLQYMEFLGNLKS